MTAHDFEQALPASENITREVLDNGVIVLVYEKPSVQSVVIDGTLPAGALYDTPEKAGLANLTAEALMAGTQTRDFDGLHTELESFGADIGVDAGRYKAGFDGKALAEDLPHLLGLLADVLRNPTFPPEHVERMRGELLTYLNYHQQDTRYLARRGFSETLYPQSHPYHYSTNGSIESVSTLTAEDLRAFHETYYGPKDMILVIVGNVRAAEAVDVVREKFGDWQAPDQPGMPDIPAAPQTDETQRHFRPVPGKTQSDIVMGFVGPSRFADDYRAAVLANSVLGQFGMMGRIGKVVREQKGYAYYSRSSVSGGFGPGSWSAMAGVNPDNVEETVEDITTEFRRITSEHVSDDDLDDVKSYYTGSLPLQLESNEGVAGTLLRMESFELGLDYLVHYRDNINRLTKDDLLNAAKHYIDVDKLTISVAGPDRG